VHKRKQYPFITKGTGEKGKKMQTLERIKCVKKIRKQQNMKNIQFAIRHTKIGNTRKVTVIPTSKSLYIPSQSKKDCSNLRTWLPIHASPSISNYTISDFQEIWYRGSLEKVADHNCISQKFVQ
jgi:hypothetical protein